MVSDQKAGDPRTSHLSSHLSNTTVTASVLLRSISILDSRRMRTQEKTIRFRSDALIWSVELVLSA